MEANDGLFSFVHQSARLGVVRQSLSAVILDVRIDAQLQ